MGLYRDQFLPRFTNRVMDRQDLAPIRSRVCDGLTGEVLEIGFGSGLNLPFYPLAVDRVRAVDPATAGRKLAARRVGASKVPVEYLGLDGQDLPLGTASVHHVVSTWTLCTIPDVARALSEVRRVLRPSGTFRFAEHGRAADEKVARWQDLLTPLQRRLAGGCHLNRRIGQLIEGSGLKLASMDTYYIAGPKVLSYTFEGAAVHE
jgi:ubiquinone/menaquinone biosynthesis C-methylase UbiE